MAAGRRGLSVHVITNQGSNTIPISPTGIVRLQRIFGACTNKSADSTAIKVDYTDRTGASRTVRASIGAPGAGSSGSAALDFGGILLQPGTAIFVSFVTTADALAAAVTGGGFLIVYDQE